MEDGKRERRRGEEGRGEERIRESLWNDVEKSLRAGGEASCGANYNFRVQ